jgi:hypothetical protein
MAGAPERGDANELGGLGDHESIAFIVPADQPDLYPGAAAELLALQLEAHRNLHAEREANSTEAA